MKLQVPDLKDSVGPESCVGCGSERFVEERGFLVCMGCGLVREEVIVSENLEKRRQQLSDSDYGHVSFHVPNYVNNGTPPRNNFYDNAVVINTIKLIAKIGAFLELPNYQVWHAQVLYRRLVRQHNVKHHVVLAAVCIYLETPPSLSILRIVAAFRENRKRVSHRMVRKIILDLNLGKLVAKRVSNRNPSVEFSRIADLLIQQKSDQIQQYYGIENRTYRFLFVKLGELCFKRIVEKTRLITTKTIAVSTYYAQKYIALLFQKKPLFKQKEIAQLLGVSTFTLRNYYWVFSKNQELAVEYARELLRELEGA